MMHFCEENQLQVVTDPQLEVSKNNLLHHDQQKCGEPEPYDVETEIEGQLLQSINQQINFFVIGMENI